MLYKKKNLLKLKRKRAGSIKLDENIYLDRNERAVPYSNQIKKSLSKELEKVSLNFYPEIDHFYKILARFISFPRNGLFLTEGVSGAIKVILESLDIKKNNSVIFPETTFAMYDVYAKMFSLKVKNLSYKAYKLSIKELEKKIDKNTAIVFLPNPNIPIDSMFSMRELKYIADLCRKHKTILVIDEVYYPFSNFTAKKLIKYYKDTFILQSFSKAFGLAGIRLGYILGSKENINYISKMRTGYEANSTSLSIATYFINHYSIIEEYIKSIKKGLIYLQFELTKINVNHIGGSNGNYIYIYFKNKKIAQYFHKELQKRKFFVRGNWPKPFENGILVSGAPKNIMIKFYKNFYDIHKNFFK